MKKLIICTTILALLPYGLALSTVINVPGDQPTIQQGIDASVDGDTVLVQPGTYVENINFNGHNIVLGSLFLTTGDTSFISTTIINGDSAGSVVTFENSEDSAAGITGFTITNGHSDNGGGIKCLNASTPTIKYDRIYNNLADFKGAGIYCGDSSNALITNNAIDSNFAANADPVYNGGGGIACYFSDPIIAENLISFNKAPSGGGVGCFESSPLIKNNSITQNTSYHVYYDCGGGGIACSNYSHAVIEFNHIYENATLYGYGGGIYSSEHSDAVIRKNVIELNTAGSNDGGGIAAVRYSNCNISENIIKSNYSGYGGGIVILFSSHAFIFGNLIAFNSAYEDGGGIFIDRTNSHVSYNVIFGNEAMLGYGGGLWGGFANNFPLMHNNTISNNTAVHYSAVTIYSWTAWEFYNNICLGEDSLVVSIDSSVQVTYCNIKGGYPGEGNIDCDPGFCDPDSGNFNLDIFSCCVGAGRDSLGNPDPNVNIGALGIGCNLSGICDYVVGDVNWSGGFNGLDVIYSVNYFKGGSPPIFVCECTAGNIWYVSGDVNSSCNFNGLDVTTMVNYLKGGSPLLSCPDCPPVTE